MRCVGKGIEPMKLMTCVIAGSLAMLLLMPANGFADDRRSADRPRQVSNEQMPFPKLMTSIFGNRPAKRSARRAATRAAMQDRSGIVWRPVPGQRLPKRRMRNGAPRSAVTARRAIGAAPPARTVSPRRQAGQVAYAPPPAKRSQIDPKYTKQVVDFDGKDAPGTIVIDTNKRFLYLVQQDGKAVRYGVGVGRPGFEWAGTHKVTRKAEWPDWRPPAEMRERQPNLPEFMPGGPRNPLGARALYLGSTLYRIHGSNEPWTIGRAVSSGCIRMRNEDVIDLYEQVSVGANVKVI